MNPSISLLDEPFLHPLRRCSERLLKALERAGKRTLRDVVAMSEVDVLSLRNIGEITLHELKVQLTELGFTLGGLPPELTLPKATNMTLRDYCAMQSIETCSRFILDSALIEYRTLAMMAYQMADAMLEERERPPGQHPDNPPPVAGRTA